MAGASIIIPVYNALEFARACLESVYEARTSVPFEVIVVDNGSAPEVAVWLAQEREQRQNLVVMRFDQPLGFSSRQRGSAPSEARYSGSVEQRCTRHRRLAGWSEGCTSERFAVRRGQSVVHACGEPTPGRPGSECV